MYLNEIYEEEHSDYYAYSNNINEWLCHGYKLQAYATVEDENNRIDIRDEIGYN